MGMQRYDIGTLQPAKRRQDGTVVAEAHLTRTGVFTYRNQDGSTRTEYRPDAEVFAPASLDSFKLVPVTDDHPPEMLTAATAKQYSVGATGENIRRDENHVLGTIAVHDARTIAKMDAGKLQVSCGYECDIDETPGTAPDGTRYDAVQRNIKGNHLAIVQRGRADSARIRMDAAFMADEPAPSAHQRQDSVMTLEQALSALATAQEKLGAEKARADAADKTAGERKTELDKLTASHDELKLKFDTADKARKDAVDATPKLVRARVELETKAAPVMKDLKMDSLSDREIRVAVIKHISNVEIGADRSDEYVTARFDAAIERASTSAEVFKGAMGAIVAGRADGAQSQSPSELARIERDKENANLYAAHRAAVAAGKVG